MNALTNKCQGMSQFLSKQGLTTHTPFRPKTRQIFDELYRAITASIRYSIQQFATTPIAPDYTRSIRRSSDISKPKQFSPESFPPDVHQHIHRHAYKEVSFSFSLGEGENKRSIQLMFVLETRECSGSETALISALQRYVVFVASWFHMAANYAPPHCAKQLRVYLYLTSLQKRLPPSREKGVPLGETHVNTAFTTSCPRESEIVVFRKEEWFKVLIHETFHNFGLDYSGMDASIVDQRILELYEVPSLVHSYEAYTEFWAEVINVCYCSYVSLSPSFSSPPPSQNEFLTLCETYMYLERTHSAFQMVKVLDYMGLTYRELISRTKVARNKRREQYREKSNVLSYFVVKTVLIGHFPAFLNWCRENNDPLLHFRPTKTTQRSFAEWIARHYKSPSLMNEVDEVEDVWEEYLNSRRRHHKWVDVDITRSARMSLFELG